MLAQIAHDVYTVERIGALVAKARRNLQALKIKNVRADARRRQRRTWAKTSAVDAIVVTAGATHVPSTLLGYLKSGGRMVLPLRAARRARTRACSG